MMVKRVPRLKLFSGHRAISLERNSSKSSERNSKKIILKPAELSTFDNPINFNSLPAPTSLSSKRNLSSNRSSSICQPLANSNLGNKTATKPLSHIKNFDVFPEWLVQRPDFIKCSTRRASILDIASIVAIYPSQFRTEIEKDFLFKWVNKTRFFSSVPNSITREVCDKLTRQDFNVGDYIVRKGEAGDCCYLLFLGNAGVYIENEVFKSTIDAGEIIGEHALDTNKLRSANIIALTPCIAFKLKKQDYTSILINIKKLEKYSITKFLLSMAIFSSWSLIKTENLSNHLIYKSYSSKEILFDKGQESDTFFILRSGEVLIEAYVDIYTKNLWPTGPQKWKVRQIHKKYLTTIMTIRPGMYFGEFGVINKALREERASCITDVTCLVINIGEFFDVFSEKDIFDLANKGFVKIPDKHVLEERVAKEMKDEKEKESALVEAVDMDFSDFKCRETIFDNRSKRVKKWVGDRKDVREGKSLKMKKKVVEVNRKVFDLSSLAKLKNYQDVIK